MIDGRINFRKLEIFCLVVELKSVSAAARQLYLVQPAVSEHLRTLERRLGYKLITRRGRGFELTDAGQRFYAWSTEVLSRARELERELDGLADGSQGAVTVGASTTVGTYLLPETVADLALSRPHARVSLKSSVMESAIDGATSGRLDFSVVVAARGMAMTDILAVPVMVEPYVLIAPADARHIPAEVGVDDLSRLPFVCAANEGLRRELIDEPLMRLGVEPRKIVVELGHPEAIKRAVERGLGIAFLLRAAVERELDSGRVKEVATDVSLSAPISIIHRVNRTFSPLQEELMAMIKRDLSLRDARLNGPKPVLSDGSAV